MLALSDQQLADIRAAAYLLPRALRSAFLQKLAARLAGRDYGDGDVHRAAHAAVHELLTEPRSQPQRRPARERENAVRGFGVMGT